MAVRADLKVAVDIGAQHAHTPLLQPRERPRCRMAVPIAGPRADEADTRSERIQPVVGCGAPRAVVRDLEHVKRVLVATDAHGQQPRVDIVLDVARQEHPPLTEADVEHDRGVVHPSTFRG